MKKDFPSPSSKWTIRIEAHNDRVITVRFLTRISAPTEVSKQEYISEIYYSLIGVHRSVKWVDNVILMRYSYDQPGSDKSGLVSTDRTNVGELGTIRRILSET